MFENHKLEKVLLAIGLIGWGIFLWILSRPTVIMGGMFGGIEYMSHLLIAKKIMIFSALMALVIFLSSPGSKDKTKIVICVISVFPAIHFLLWCLGGYLNS